MNVYKRTRLSGLALLLSALTASAASGSRHPPVSEAAGCVTLQCHGRLLQAASATKAGSVHQPAASGECRSCHDLARGAGTPFVTGVPAGPGEESESGRAWDLALCSGCHGEGLLAPDASPGATGFVDGTRNLHAHHVLAGRGRRCLNCHDPHAAGQPKLLREQIPARANARIAQQFRGAPNGGWCKTGCHAPKSYVR